MAIRFIHFGELVANAYEFVKNLIRIFFFDTICGLAYFLIKIIQFRTNHNVRIHSKLPSCKIAQFSYEIWLGFFF